MATLRVTATRRPNADPHRGGWLGRRLKPERKVPVPLDRPRISHASVGATVGASVGAAVTKAWNPPAQHTTVSATVGASVGAAVRKSLNPPARHTTVSATVTHPSVGASVGAAVRCNRQCNRL